MLTEVVFGYSLLHLQPFFLIFCLLLDDIIHCIVLIFVYICSEFISEQHGTWHLASAKQTPPSSHLPRTKAVPSSLHACISLAPSMHDNRTVYAVSMRVSRIINLRNPELLFLPWSEQGANKERRNASETCKNQHYLSYHPQAFSVDPWKLRFWTNRLWKILVKK